MRAVVATRSRWIWWLAAIVIFIAVCLYPVSNRFTRACGAWLFCVLWIGLVAAVWKWRIGRFTMLGITATIVIFLLLPGRTQRDAAALRNGYVEGLLRYEGVRYFWGGECATGIDCSGLIRRGLVDSLCLRGVRTLDPGLVRHALWLWWHDCTARALGEGHGMTSLLLETPSINVLDHAKILPGDIAVTANGLHIMAYLGGNRWIEADPGPMSVIVVSVPEEKNPWFGQPMKVMRWDILGQKP